MHMYVYHITLFSHAVDQVWRALYVLLDVEIMEYATRISARVAAFQNSKGM